MKKNRICVIVCEIISVLFIIPFLYFIQNKYIILTGGDSYAPSFSHEGGFYNEPIMLSLYAKNDASIYYTLDGSIPDENSIKYSEPIHLGCATDNDNTYSMIKDFTITEEIAKKYGVENYPDYTTPDYNIDKCNIVRAIAVYPNGGYSNVVSASFFVGLEPQKYNSDSIISVIADPDDLFSYDKGIYVNGKIMDDYINEGDVNVARPTFWPANYNQRGVEWERPIHYEDFGADGTINLSENAGIRVQGNTSRAHLPRSLSIYAREEYDKNNVFDYYPFKEGYKPQRLVLSAGGNKILTQFNDYMMSMRTQNLNFGTADFKSTTLFLNGEYWGSYFMSEKYDPDYIEFHYGVDKDNVLIVKNYDLDFGPPKIYDEYWEMMDFFDTADMRDEANYAKAQELVDFDSLIDYYAANIYIARSHDWPDGNFAVWRSAKSGKKAYEDKKWRWLLFDSNSASMGDVAVDHNTFEMVLENDRFMRSLWQNDDFKKRFTDRIFYIADNCFDANDMSLFIDDYIDENLPRLEMTYNRFYGLDNEKTKEFLEDMERQKLFFNNRRQVVKEWFE